MSLSHIAQLISGVALFLFGMSLMGDSLKQVAGSKLEIILYRLTGSPLKGALFGAGVTAVIQSSSATSVMVIGFVNAGVMSVRQAVSVILGAILGTSATGWVLCLSDIGSSAGILELFSTEMLTCIAALTGILLVMFSKKQQRRHVGHILLGFAILMVGMASMSGAVHPLQDNETFIRILTRFSNPVLGILAGAAFTAVLQSASAAVGILQALSMTGTVRFDTALPLIMGISIGAAVPVLLAAVSASPKGKRTSFFYLLSSVLGVIIIAAIFYALNAAFDFSFMSHTLSSVAIALLNTVFRLLIVLILLPMISPLEKTLEKLFPDTATLPASQGKLSLLEERLVRHPALAIEQCRIVVEDMLQITRESLLHAERLQEKYDSQEYESIHAQENLVDAYEDKLSSYMLLVTQEELEPRQSAEIGKYVHTISDFERLSDHAVNLAELAKEKAEKGICLSTAAQGELNTVQRAVAEIMDLAFDAYLRDDIAPAARVEALGKVIASLCGEIRLRHMQRLEHGQCSLEAGYYLNDLLSNYKRIADHCSNISVGMISVRLGSFDTHEYQDHLRSFKTGDFESAYARYAALYALAEKKEDFP